MIVILPACCLCAPSHAFAQAADAALPNSPSPKISAALPAGSSPVSNATLPDSPSPGPQSPQDASDSPTRREVTWHTLPKDFLQDQKGIWLFPTQLAKGHHWLPTLAIVGGTAGLIEADQHVMPYFRDHAAGLDDLNDTFDSTITTAEVVAVPASLMIVGYARHSQYQVSTALLAGVAYADSAVVDLAIKAITRRERPSDIPTGKPFTNTFFNGGKSPFKGSSFPSGHAAGVFSVATVVASRYSKHRWIPWVAYGFATAISFSRVTTSSHFPSDVFLGAALGYTITRYQTLMPR
ncbi:MAG TPA: phosphatase PAP2 family protein [Candidatus Angelobacter sp.]|nr:phosphatase PAP2 family protein [Candidatus Angelobacter sp.]